MSGYVMERYHAQQIPTNSTTVLAGISGVGGFLAITAGTITIITNTVIPRTIVPVLTVAANTYYPLPFFASVEGMVVTTAGGASGVLGTA